MISLNDLYWVLGEQNLGPLEFYFAKALKKNNKNSSYINIHSLYPDYWKKLTPYSHRFPRKFDNAVQKKYYCVINESVKQKYLKEKPSFIFVYNDCKLLPETIKFFRSNGTKVIVFLGDDPNYLIQDKKLFLLNVIEADYVILPDTGWIDGLKMVGVENIIHSPIGTDTDTFFKMTPSAEDQKKYCADFLFIGTGYFLNSWGLRRATLLNELTGFNLKIFGDKFWYELFDYYPELQNHFTCNPLPANIVNIACNCASIYPVVVNSGVVNGVSTRVFDCMASGIFVLAEYRKDIELFFDNSEIVFFKSKKELKDKASYFLKNKNEMKDISENARKKVIENYTLEKSLKNILEQII
ncbi:MAG: hypothetical protein HGGPFJEG_01247 [Ignavibacteria bacterium]|nr:hypothetical protein [Ignavibacteria bacterium]